MKVIAPEVRLANPLLGRVAEDALGLTADEDHLEGVRLGLPDDAVNGVDEGFEAVPTE